MNKLQPLDWYFQTLELIESWVSLSSSKLDFSTFPVVPNIKVYDDCFRYILLSLGTEDYYSSERITLKSQLDWNLVNGAAQSWSRTAKGAKAFLEGKSRGHYVILLKGNVIGIDVCEYATTVAMELERYIKLFGKEVFNDEFEMEYAASKLAKLKKKSLVLVLTILKS
jgi:hypothetical protein